MDNIEEHSNNPSSANLSSTNNQDEEKNSNLKRKRMKARTRKRLWRKRMRARMRRPVNKSPLMVFNELFGDKIPIRVLTSDYETFIYYTAIIEVDGCVYKGEHVYRVQAKEIACENYLRYLLMNKLNEKPAMSPNDKRQGDFPWMQFVSLAMYNLMTYWKLGNGRIDTRQYEYASESVMPWEKPFPPDADKRGAVDVLYQLIPGLVYNQKTIELDGERRYECTCTLHGLTFTSAGFSTKRGAKRDCATQIVREFWGYDFDAAIQV